MHFKTDFAKGDISGLWESVNSVLCHPDGTMARISSSVVYQSLPAMQHQIEALFGGSGHPGICREDSPMPIVIRQYHDASPSPTKFAYDAFKVRAPQGLPPSKERLNEVAAAAQRAQPVSGWL